LKTTGRLLFFGTTGEESTVFVTRRDIRAGEELVHNYHILYPDEPEWYDDLYLKFLGEEPWREPPEREEHDDDDDDDDHGVNAPPR
jgi:SET domain-containing protein